MRLLLPSDVDAPSTEAITRLVGSVVNQAQTWEWGEQARSAWSARRIRFVCSKCGDPQTFLTLTEEPRVRQDHADLGVTILVNDD